MNSKKQNFKVGAWLYFFSPEATVLERWWQVTKIKSKHFRSDRVTNIPAGECLHLGIDYAGTTYWYAEYILWPYGNKIKYVDTPEEKLFLQLSQKDL